VNCSIPAFLLTATVALAPPATADTDGTTWFLGGGRTAGSPSELTIEQARERLTDREPDPRIDAVIQYSRDGVHTGRPFGEAVREGTANAVAVVAPGDTVIGYSQGAAIAQQLKKILAGDPSVSGADYAFITFGDPTNSKGGEMPFMRSHRINLGDILPPLAADDETMFTTITVAQEYDRIADFPDRPWNLAAVYNALLSAEDHLGYQVDWSDIAEHQRAAGVHFDGTLGRDRVITTERNSKGGNNIHVLVKSETLPLTRPLRSGISWLDRVVDAIDTPLRWLIDAGYTDNRTG